jgi:hypothetical protein
MSTQGDGMRVELTAWAAWAAWAARNGMVLVDLDEHERLCADAAEAIIESTDIDAEFRILISDV